MDMQRYLPLLDLVDFKSEKTGRSLGVTSQWLKHLILLLIFNTISAVQAETKNTCEAELRVADQKYRAGELDSAAYLIRLCLNKKEATKKDSVWAYKLLGKVYIARQDINEAKNAFGEMLKLNPKTTLDETQETLEVMAIFNEVKTTFEKQRGKNWQWLFVAIIISIILILIMTILTIRKKIRNRPEIDWPVSDSMAFSESTTKQTQTSNSLGDITKIENMAPPSGFFSNAELRKSQFFSREPISYSKIEQTLTFYRDHLSKEYEGLAQQVNVTFCLWITCVVIGFLI